MNIHRKTAAATKRIKTEEMDPLTHAATPTAFNFAPVRDTPPEVQHQMLQMRDAISRLEGQVDFLRVFVFLFWKIGICSFIFYIYI